MKLKKLVKNPYLSDKEEKLVEFCKKNDINFVVNKDPSGRGVNSYQIGITPRFLDAGEKQTVQMLDKKGIKYQFAIDTNGNHHYQFDGFIDSFENSCFHDGRGHRGFVDVFNGITCTETLRHDYSENMYDVDEEKHEEEIKELKNKITELKKPELNLIGKVAYWINPWYKTKVDKQIKEYGEEINNINKLINDKNKTMTAKRKVVIDAFRLWKRMEELSS